MEQPDTADIILGYGRPTCPSVPPVLRLLDEAGAVYEYVNVRQDFEAAARLRQITGGYESVPTLVFPDGRTLVVVSSVSIDVPAGGTPVSEVAAARAALSNPVYWILALIALGLVVAVLVSIQ